MRREVGGILLACALLLLARVPEITDTLEARGFSNLSAPPIPWPLVMHKMNAGERFEQAAPALAGNKRNKASPRSLSLEGEGLRDALSEIDDDDFIEPRSSKGGDLTARQAPSLKPLSAQIASSQTGPIAAAGTIRFLPPPPSRRQQVQGVALSRNAGASASSPRARPYFEPRASVDFDGRKGAGRTPGLSSLGLRLGKSASAPKFREKEAAEKKKKENEKRETASLSDWLGEDPILQPKEKRLPPSFSALKHTFPDSLPDGGSFLKSTPPPEHAERVLSPEEHPLFERWNEIDEGKDRGENAPHWHGDGESHLYYHSGKTWAAPLEGRWSWIVESGTRWWTLADGLQRLFRAHGLWWKNTEFGAFPVSNGTLLASEFAADWKRQGTWTKESTIRFSRDLTRTAVKTPGIGTTVYDARSGQFLDRFPEKR